MKKFWKVLGAAALIAGFTPYRISGDKETDSLKIDALLWQASSKPGDGVTKRKIDINFGFPPKAEEETHIFTDEVTVKYGESDDAEPEAFEAPEEVKREAEEPEAETAGTEETVGCEAARTPEETAEAEEPVEPEAPEEIEEV